MTVILTDRVQFAVTKKMKDQAEQTAAELAVSPATVYRMALSLFLERGVDYGPQRPTSEQPAPARAG